LIFLPGWDNGLESFSIVPFAPDHRKWAADFMDAEWGSQRMVSRGKLYRVLDYPGFVALVDGQPGGISTYYIDGQQCEVLLLHSLVEGVGIGAALVEVVRWQAQAAGCRRLWLVTTNDNIHAFRWYQRRGFTIAAIHVNALAESRELKPEIPLIGLDGIPLRDEIEFEMMLG
jgi:GNAT superfamily N-acetyltransferase